MRKYKKHEVSQNFINQLVDYAMDEGVYFEIYESTLNDNLIFYDAEPLKMKGLKNTRYIIIESVFRTTWTNDLYMIRTNDDQLVNEYIEIFQN